MSVKHRLQAWAQLAGRYRSVFMHAWRDRHASASRFLNEDEAAYLPAALAIQQKPLSSTVRWTGRTLMALVVFTVAWACLGTIDIVVSASGKVVPSSRTKTITSVDVAVVRALHVQEGQPVKAGDVLLELDASATDSERDKAVGDAAASALEVARSRALIEAIDGQRAPRLGRVAGATPAQWQAAESGLESQWRDFRAKLGRFDDAIAQYTQDLPLASRRADDYKQLLRDHDVSEHAWMEKEQARIDLQGQLDDARNQRAALISQTRKDAHDALDEGAKADAASRQDARRAGEHSKLMTLVTPVDGTVQQLTVHTVGAAVPAAQPLMMVVPTETHVEVEAFLENKDIGFVTEGQVAEVKIDAYEYTKYGTIPARVTHVSRDAIQDDKKGLIYAVKITLERPFLLVEGRMVPATAGMSSTVEIKTGSRRVIEYVLSPLVQHVHESLHER
jgi:hemolysin D